MHSNHENLAGLRGNSAALSLPPLLLSTLKVSQGWDLSFHRDGDSVRDPAGV